MKIEEKEFLASRPAVLASWPTGAEVDLGEAVEYQHGIPPNRQFALKMAEAARDQKVLLQPRAGVALTDEHIELLRFLQDDSDLLPTTIDAYTRLNKYAEAQKGIEQSVAAGHSLLNGFPAVNHGLRACRRVVESLDKPVEIRHGTPDARLLAEITMAAGFTSFEGGGISYNIPYAKKVPLEHSIACWQYVDRLVGYYEDRGVRINREPFGPLSGTLVPPFISHAVAILEGLLALEQGVRSLTLGYGQLGNLTQDAAAMISLRSLAEEYFHYYGFRDYELSTVFHQWMGGFPEDESQAFGVIGWGAAAGALAKATKIIVKTPHEAMGIPTREANRQGIRCSRQMVNMLADQHVHENLELHDEVELIKREVHSVLGAALELGKDNFADAACRAFAAGLIDVPFAPAACNRGKLMPVRDNHGAVRILDPGQVPLTRDILATHQAAIQTRADYEHRTPSFQMVVDDIYAIGKGKLTGRPR